MEFKGAADLVAHILEGKRNMAAKSPDRRGSTA